MGVTRSIYKPNRYNYNAELERVKTMATTPYNREQILSWHNHLSATNSGLYRICKLSNQIRRLVSAWHSVTDKNKDLSTIDKQSFEKVVGWINQREGWSPATKADYRRCIRQFFTWYEEVDPRLNDPPEIDITAEKEEQRDQWRERQEAFKTQKEAREFYAYVKKHVKRNYKAPEHDFSDVVTDADLRTVINTCKNSRDRALLGVLHEGGLRAAELLNLRIKDIEHNDDRVLLHVDGKTGRRPVPIILNMPYLLRWLDDHPQRESREAFVWVGLSSRNKDQPIFHSAASRMIEKAFKRAGIKKKHNMHWFRHSRASLYYGRMNDGELCDFFGWEKGSDMIKTYSHTKNEGAQEALNRIYNISSAQEKTVLLTCAACGLHNTPQSRFCGRCKLPLSTEARDAKEQYMAAAFELMGRIMADPELRKEFEAFAKRHDDDLSK